MQTPMQMQHVRVPRAPQVPVPPVSNTPLNISSEVRQQLRVTRHRAFERHQENAQWTAELLGDVKTQSAAVSSSTDTVSAEELQRQIAAKKEAVEQLERQLTQDQVTQEAAQQRFEEMLSALKNAADEEAVKQCREQVESEKTTLLTTKHRKMEIVRL
ncbi:hypothetical protein BBJ29_002977 [Phytophthora kernoviae]|uniref:Uncharacterized protein n=1 Tax=Phytophthora kernoviae TaxID=325452 RepID=A0A3F2RPE5_9STRA|nr:hypothetical protein BBJ29_002977 [Phytophthora kernoviae]RLN61672.1 hypothetical protein BBP00_00005250 [Phytophthora kernoviae]